MKPEFKFLASPQLQSDKTLPTTSVFSVMCFTRPNTFVSKRHLFLTKRCVVLAKVLEAASLVIAELQAAARRQKSSRSESRSRRQRTGSRIAPKQTRQATGTDRRSTESRHRNQERMHAVRRQQHAIRQQQAAARSSSMQAGNNKRREATARAKQPAQAQSASQPSPVILRYFLCFFFNHLCPIISSVNIILLHTAAQCLNQKYAVILPEACAFEATASTQCLCSALCFLLSLFLPCFYPNSV